MVADMNLSKAEGLAKVAKDAAAIENITPGEALEVHQVQDALVDGAAEVLPQEGPVDALLVELDDGIGWERLIGVGHRTLVC